MICTIVFTPEVVWVHLFEVASMAMGYPYDSKLPLWQYIGIVAIHRHFGNKVSLQRFTGVARGLTARWPVEKWNEDP